MRAAAVDLDNCISDDRWRWPLFKLHLEDVDARYQDYHEQCERDAFENRMVLTSIASNHDIIILTARPESVRAQTVRWLHRHRIPVTHLVMRKIGDHTPSVELKRIMLRERIPKKYVIRTAIDDRIDICDMYADEGVDCVRRVVINPPEHIHP